MSTHLTIKNENRPNLRTPTPFLSSDSSWGYDLFCGKEWNLMKRGLWSRLHDCRYCCQIRNYTTIFEVLSPFFKCWDILLTNQDMCSNRTLLGCPAKYFDTFQIICMLHVTYKLVLQAKPGESGNRPQVKDLREFNSFTKCCPRNYIIFFLNLKLQK